MNRIEKLRRALPADFEAAVIQHGPNRQYFSRFPSSAGVLVVTPRRAVLFVDFRYIEAAKMKAQDVEVVLMGKVWQQVAELLAAEHAHKVLVEREISLETFHTMRKELPGVEFDDGDAVSGAAIELRAIKEDEEIAAICAAQAITDAAFQHICSFIKEGQTEREIAAELEYTMRRAGADGMAFETICVSGENTSLPHGVPGERKVRKGDFLTMDFGALKDGYCSDMTRTVALGSISAEQQKVYDTVLAAHMAARAAAKAGITGVALDKAARDVIDDAGYKGCFGHSLGHSLGLEIHEEPRASATWDKVLPAGTVITIEPGVYLEGRFGVRIENMVLLTADGCRDLTASPRELIVL